jgi:hypothetical protein
MGGDWRWMYSMATGAPPSSDYVPPYVASLIFFFVNALVGVGLRGLTKAFVPGTQFCLFVCLFV